jgi:RNA polymerase sigma-54 factor
MPSQKTTISQTQKQKVKLSPHQEMRINILQLSNLQLMDKIKEELLQNPVLEEDEISSLQLPIVDPPSIKEEKQDEINWEDFFESSRNPLEYEPTTNNVDAKPIYDNIPTQQPTLREYLLQQLRMIPISNKEYEIGELIIDNINEDGYFQYPVEKIADEAKVSIEEVEKVLYKIQEFEPPGVAARDLKECLLLQIKDLGMENSHLNLLVENYLSLLQQKNYEYIAKQMNISIKHVKELIKALVKLLDPKPARLYEKFQPPQIIPEIIISNTEDKGLTLEVNDEWIPSLRISPYYQKLLKDKNLSPAENEYIQKKMKSALFFLECMEKRKETLRYVAKVIFERQKEFLQEGELKLVPMKLEDIAKEVNLHLSTVSRAIANKFVKTPHGVHPLKFFFRIGMRTKEGDAISTITIKEKIKEIVANEDKQKPLSDSKIAALLQQQGINIAIRTVAKYREELNIPSSFSRKKISY